MFAGWIDSRRVPTRAAARPWGKEERHRCGAPAKANFSAGRHVDAAGGRIPSGAETRKIGVAEPFWSWWD
jgi:hypothetical protein